MGRKKSKKNYDKKDKRLRSRKRKGGIWITNKFGKAKRKIEHPPKPIVKRCVKCGAKVFHHHFLCDKHWLLKQKENETLQNEDLE